jgi:hypothetical protein
MPKVRKIHKKFLDSKSYRKRADGAVEIGLIPPVLERPINSDNETIEIDKWLKLVESYWQKGTRRKTSFWRP